MLFSLHPDDRATYGGPEWLDVSAAVEAVNDLDLDALAALDAEVVAVTGAGLVRLIGRISTFQIAPLRLALWLGLRHAGVDIPLADFKPANMLKFGMKSGDADPPASTPGPSPDSSDSSTSATTPASQKSASGSTRGSRARTSSSQRKSAR